MEQPLHHPPTSPALLTGSELFKCLPFTLSWSPSRKYQRTSLVYIWLQIKTNYSKPGQPTANENTSNSVMSIIGQFTFHVMLSHVTAGLKSEGGCSQPWKCQCLLRNGFYADACRFQVHCQTQSVCINIDADTIIGTNPLLTGAFIYLWLVTKHVKPFLKSIPMVNN